MFQKILLFVPPIVKLFLNRIFRRLKKEENWQIAILKSDGYCSKEIFEKVKNSAIKVNKGIYPYERDGVNFKNIQYSWPLLAGLLYSSSINKGNLNVCDFGGSFGSSYFQNILFLNHLKNLSWNIIEQKHFVDYGNQKFKRSNLNFYNDIYDFKRVNSPHVLLLSGVLQYLEMPFEILNNLLSLKFKVVLLDRTPFSKIKEEEDYIFIQKVPRSIYKSSYPSWVFNLNNLISFFSKRNYEVLEIFDSIDPPRVNVEYRGMIFLNSSK